MLPVNTTWVMSSYKDGIHGMEWNLFNHNTALIYFFYISLLLGDHLQFSHF